MFMVSSGADPISGNTLLCPVVRIRHQPIRTRLRPVALPHVWVLGSWAIVALLT
jgi:hypothetical protein